VPYGSHSSSYKSLSRTPMRHHDASDWAKSGAPIAQVLNNTSSIPYAAESMSTIQSPPTAPFSGKLIDLLLDTPEQHFLNERKRADYQVEESCRISCDNNSVIKLPQPPKLLTKSTKRARIPPLLQGLHQPPPLPPAGRLFPPITHGASGFEQDICDRVQSGNVSQEARSKTDRENVFNQTAEPNDRNGDHSGDDREVVPLSTPLIHGSDQVTTSQSKFDGNVFQGAPLKPRGKKRKKWSDEETRDLLLGVSRYGIGKWKRILHCEDFKFNGRTAVDLKDRFRVCCPGEGVNPRGSKRKDRTKHLSNDLLSATIQPNTGKDASATQQSWQELSNGKEVFAKGAGNVHRMSHPELAKMGIQTPFAQSTRRPRQVFSSFDDENLLKGFEKYGTAWHSMRDDTDLGFSGRHPTDLRDRFRIRYPEAYTRAGYKLKPKIKSNLGRERERERNAKHVTSPSQQKSPSAVGQMRPPEELPSHGNNDNDFAKRSMFTPTAGRSLPYTSFNSFSAPFFLSEHTLAISAADDNDTNASMSPIILNRDILTWADANTYTSTSMSSNINANTTSHLPPDISHDGIHIDPLATLKLPLMGHSAFPHNTNSRTLYPDWPNPSSSSSASASKDLLRTPNLPTIVYPHVPASSARTMVHNLPTPRDLLEGLDVDGMGQEG
jgi:hypothetical protein